MTSTPDANKMELVSFIGRQFTDASTDQNYKDNIKFKITSKVYSEEFAAGQIITQNPKAGEIVENGTTIEVVVSLGPQIVTMPKISDMTYEAAVLELLKAGFSYYNIAEPMHMEDENASPGVVIKSDPEEGMRVSLDTQVTLIINTYTGEPVDPPVGINPDNNDNNNYN